MELNEFSQKALPRIENEIKTIIDLSLQGDKSDLRSVFLYHLGLSESVKIRGKRIRPLLVLLTTKACGGKWEKAISAGAAVELLHNFSLIHDDIEDRSNLRHGRATVWNKWGTAQAINAGDGMFAIVFKAIHRLAKNNSLELTLKASELITDSCLKLVEGQFLDMFFEGKEELSLADYWTMIGGKTAALLGFCTRMGGLVAGLKESEQVKLYEFGYNLGLAFQVQDDFLGIWGNAAETGKPAENDLINRKLTLPVIFGLQMSPRFASRWKKSPLTQVELPVIKKWLEEDGIHEQTKNIIATLNNDLNNYFSSTMFIEDEGKQLLWEIMDVLRERKK